jgi:hypothetical protein
LCYPAAGYTGECSCIAVTGSAGPNDDMMHLLLIKGIVE